MKIVLIGYMGAGKSSVGKLLAEKLNVSFIDLDTYIEQAEAISIDEIFNTQGEVYFRKKEHQYLTTLLTSDENMILSVGGGTPCFSNNLELIHKLSISIYLKTSITTLCNRLASETAHRPLLATISQENLPEFIGKHLFERIPFYTQSTLEIQTDGQSINSIADALHTLIVANLGKH